MGFPAAERRCAGRPAWFGRLRLQSRSRSGDPLVDDYLVFVAARCRPSTVLATAYDLKVFFEVVGKEPARVSTADVFAFIAA